MNMMQLLLTLQARYKVALLVLFCTVAVALTGNQYLPRQYIATAAVAFDLRSPDPVAGVILPLMVATQVEIVKSDRVAHKVVRLLKLDESPAVKAQWRENADGEGKLEQWLTDSLQRGLEVTPSRESNIIRISYKASDAGFAAAVANAFAQAYVETTIEMRVEPARQHSRWLEDQGKLLRENVEGAQSRLSAYQQKSGIVATDERLDDEAARLSQLSTQLTTLQESLRTDIARQEIKLKEAAVNLGRNHPDYQNIESELAELKKRLEREVSSNKESELRAAIEAQRKRLLELRSARDHLAVLQRDVDAAQRIYDTVMQRFNQTSLESQATLTNVSLFAPANEPTAPSFPKPLRTVLLLSIFLGLALGAGAAFMLEMLDRRIRCVDELAEMLQMPVLCVIERGKRRGRPAVQRSHVPLALR